MAQATGMRHTVERMRCLWPDSTGVLYYKINDNNPATSWATVDWFGCAKIAYHVLRQSYRPVHGCILFDRLICIGESLSLPVMLLNDADCTDAMPVTVAVRAFDSRLECVEKQVPTFKAKANPINFPVATRFSGLMLEIAEKCLCQNLRG